MSTQGQLYIDQSAHKLTVGALVCTDHLTSERIDRLECRISFEIDASYDGKGTASAT
jgi:hypothetical protein